MVIQPKLSPSNQRELGRLLVSIRANAQRLDLFLAVCDDPGLRETIIRQYESALHQDGCAAFRTRLDPKAPSLKVALADLVRYNPALRSGNKAVVTVLGGSQLLGVRLSEEKSEQEKFFFSLQWTREALREFAFPVVIWLSDTVATGIAQQARDFWSWRSGVFEFESQIQEFEPSYNDRQYAETQLQTSAQDKISDKEKALALPSIPELEQEITTLRQQTPKSPLLITLYSDLGDAYHKQSDYKSALANSAPC
jgi:hypothetical protein